MSSSELRRPSRAVGYLVPILAVVIGTFFFHRYSILTELNVVQADTGDSRFVTAILEHWNNVLHGTANWRSVPMFWPAKDTLAFSDALVGMGIIHVALRTVLGVFAAVNAQEILLTILSFAATYALFKRGLLLSVWGATLGAAFATFCWPRFAYMPHIQLQFTAPLSLLFLLMIEALRDGIALSRLAFAWRMVGVAALGALLLATAIYYAVFAALAVVVALALCLVYAPSRRHVLSVVRRQWPGLIAAAATVVVLSAPMVLLYMPLLRESGGRSWVEVMPGLPRPHHFFWMGRENWLWGSYFARWPEEEIEANWAELRIGVGAVATLGWALGIVWALSALRRPMPGRIGLLVLFILTGLVLQLSMLALPGGRSAWWLIWRFFPGANGVRSVARLEIVVILGMGAWFGMLLDRAMLHSRAWPKALAAVLVAVCAVEQFGWSDLFDGGRMEAFEREFAAKLAAPCEAVFVTGTPDLIPAPILDESQFDPAAYLTANPDVAKNWAGSAWSHYDLLGRAEGRVLNAPLAAERGLLAILGYNYTLPLAAVLAQKQVVNGLSGTEPPGWHLAGVLSNNSAEDLARWLALNGKPPGSVCTLPIRVSLSMIPFLPRAYWP